MADPKGKGRENVVPISVNLRGLMRVGAKPPFLDYLVSLWGYRHFVFYDAKASVQSGTSRDRLGSIWLILNPILSGLTYFLIFGVLLQASRGVDNFIGFLIIGVFLFQMSSRAVLSGSKVIGSNLKVIQAFNFPRATLLLSANMRELIGSVPVVLTMFLLILLIGPDEAITWLWVLIFPALLLQTLLNIGIGLILARVVSKVNDLSNLLSVAMRLWMYGSCVIFPISLFDRFPIIQAIIEANPIYQLLTIVRQAVLYNEIPKWESWAILCAWTFALLLVGIIFFWNAEETYGRDN